MSQWLCRQGRGRQRGAAASAFECGDRWRGLAAAGGGHWSRLGMLQRAVQPHSKRWQAARPSPRSLQPALLSCGAWQRAPSPRPGPSRPCPRPPPQAGCRPWTGQTRRRRRRGAASAAPAGLRRARTWWWQEGLEEGEQETEEDWKRQRQLSHAVVCCALCPPGAERRRAVSLHDAQQGLDLQVRMLVAAGIQCTWQGAQKLYRFARG